MTIEPVALAEPVPGHYGLPPVPAWWRLAACHSRTELLPAFFPGADARHRNPPIPLTVAELCASCPAARECLADALADDWTTDDGIRAGTTAAERRALRRAMLERAG